MSYPVNCDLVIDNEVRRQSPSIFDVSNDNRSNAADRGGRDRGHNVRNRGSQSAFDRRAHRTEQAPAHPMVSINEDGSVTVGSTRLRVVRSNIIEAPFEAIVISSDKSLSCRSVIEKQIAEVDPEFKDSCSAVPSVDGTRCGVGDSKAVSVNYSANSALKKAILVNVPSCRGRNVDPDYVKENLKKGSRSAVTLAHQLSVESVAISTLGCGNNGISFNGWAKIVPNALVEYFVENPNTAVRDTAICVLKPGQKTPIEKALQAGARRHIISQPSGQGRGSSSSSRRRS